MKKTTTDLKGTLLNSLLDACVNTVKMSNEQACLWFACQPEEPKNLKSINLDDLK